MNTCLIGSDRIDALTRESGAAERLGVKRHCDRLYDAIENGVIGVSDALLKDRIAEPTAMRDRAKATPTAPSRTSRRSVPRSCSRRGATGRGSEPRRGPYPRRAERAAADSDRRLWLEAAVLGVRSFEPKWRARNDSNVRPSDS